MSNRAEDWLRQARRDLEQARESRDSGRHEWACFAAQQAAEKAAKALHLASGQDAWGHMIAKLLRELPESVQASPELIDKGRTLDAFYTGPRYPDTYPEGAPFEHFGPLQSEQALRYASEIIAFVDSQMA
jgi:HEPN domain-containing protein